MPGLSVTFVEDGGAEIIVEDGAPGQSLMELGRANGVEGILADCGGACACATCHVYVDADWADLVGPPDAVEAELLGMVADLARENSRLACQIELRAELDGLRVTVAPSQW